MAGEVCKTILFMLFVGWFGIIVDLLASKSIVPVASKFDVVSAELEVLFVFECVKFAPLRL